MEINFKPGKCWNFVSLEKWETWYYFMWYYITSHRIIISLPKSTLLHRNTNFELSNIFCHRLTKIKIDELNLASRDVNTSPEPPLWTWFLAVQHQFVWFLNFASSVRIWRDNGGARAQCGCVWWYFSIGSSGRNIYRVRREHGQRSGDRHRGRVNW